MIVKQDHDRTGATVAIRAAMTRRARLAHHSRRMNTLAPQGERMRPLPRATDATRARKFQRTPTDTKPNADRRQAEER